MANPPHLFRVDGRLDQLVLQVRPWSDDVVDELGFDPRSSYVEDYWLGIWPVKYSKDTYSQPFPIAPTRLIVKRTDTTHQEYGCVWLAPTVAPDS